MGCAASTDISKAAAPKANHLPPDDTKKDEESPGSPRNAQHATSKDVDSAKNGNESVDAANPEKKLDADAADEKEVKVVTAEAEDDLDEEAIDRELAALRNIRKPSEISRREMSKLLGKLVDDSATYGDAGRLLAPLLTVVQASAPYVKPCANAILAISEHVGGALIQMENCQRLGTILELVPETLFQLAEAGLLGRQVQVQRAVRQLARQLYRTASFTAYFCRPRALLERLDRHRSDALEFFELSKRILDALAPVIGTATSLRVIPKIENARKRLAEGFSGPSPFFTPEPEEHELQLREWLERNGGVEVVLNDPEKKKHLRTVLSAEGRQKLLESAPESGLFLSIEHPVLRVLWKETLGADVASVDSDRFFQMLRDYFSTYEMPPGSGCFPFQSAADRLRDEQTWKKIARLIDLDQDGSVKIEECNKAFQPPEVALEDHILNLMLQPYPGNLSNPVDSGYVTRIKEEASLNAYLTFGETTSVQVTGPSDAGKSALSYAVAYSLFKGGKFQGGVFHVDCSGRPGASGIVYAIVDTLSLPPENIKDIEDVLPYLRKRVESLGPTLLVLDGIDRAIEDPKERALVAKLIKDITSPRGQVKCIVTARTALPAIPNMKSLQVAAPDRGEARSLLELLLPATDSVEITRLLNTVHSPAVTCTDLVLLQRNHREVETARLWTPASSSGAADANKSFSDIAGNQSPVTAALRYLPRHLLASAAVLSVFRSGFSGEAADGAGGVERHHLLALRDRGVLEERRGRYTFSESVLQALDSMDDLEELRAKGRAGLIGWLALHLQESAVLFDHGKGTAAVAFLDSEWSILAELWAWFTEKGTKSFVESVEAQLPVFVRATRSAWNLLNMRLPHPALFNLAEALALHPWPLPQGLRSAALADVAMDDEEDLDVARQVVFEVEKVPLPKDDTPAVVREEERLAIERKKKEEEPVLAGADARTIWGWALGSEGRHEEAYRAHKQAMMIFEEMGKVPAPANPNDRDRFRAERAVSLFSLGVALHLAGRSKEALVRHREALMMRLKYLEGDDHVDVADSYTSVAITEEALGWHEDAIAHFHKALEIRKVLQLDTLAESYADIARTYRVMEKYGESIDYFTKAINAQVSIFGETHVSVGDLYFELGEVNSLNDEKERAIAAFRRAVEISDLSEGAETIPSAARRIRLGTEMAAFGDFEEALEYVHDALTVRMKELGENHADVVEALALNALCLKNLARFDEALEFYSKAKAVQEALHGSRSAEVAEAWRDLGRLYDQWGRAEEGQTAYAEADEIDRLVRSTL